MTITKPATKAQTLRGLRAEWNEDRACGGLLIVSRTGDFRCFGWAANPRAAKRFIAEIRRDPNSWL